MRPSWIKIIVFLSIAGFSLGVMSIALHHHDNTFSLPGCFLCKAKTSFTGAINKAKADNIPVALVLCLSLAVTSLYVSGILPIPKVAFIVCQIVETYPNKAPPLIFR